jgi:hypothetical protein
MALWRPLHKYPKYVGTVLDKPLITNPGGTALGFSDLIKDVSVKWFGL